MKLITITYEEHPFGFGRPLSHCCPGVTFANGKIAFLNENGEIRQAESAARLKETFSGVSIGPYPHRVAIADPRRRRQRRYE
jgi:hypothetical protein